MSEEEVDPNAPKDLGKYEGARNEQGERHGQGRNVFPNKDIYVGEYANGKRNGKGRYFYKSDADKIGKFEGDWVEGKKCGEGVMHYPDGTTYEGHFEDGKRHGHGTYTYPNGDTYVGEWNAGKKHGKGVYNFKKENCQYIGVWKDNNMIRGMWVHKDGTYYAGQFERQRPNSQGKYVFTHNVQQGHFVETVKKEEVEVPRPKKKVPEGEEGGDAPPEEEGEPIMKTVYRIVSRQWVPEQLAVVEGDMRHDDERLLEIIPGELDPPKPPPAPVAPAPPPAGEEDPDAPPPEDQ